ncbi:unnamed protein product [Microthlaspi erraticum]|uniref:DUF1985 domain-containing protein n=1 Tax=Microthlaspi erraticum TaxID=1685480 RepID=A0A6D2I3R0_9BRAS|nr:unnamed protein product [Microthlaspi erraticum]
MDPSSSQSSQQRTEGSMKGREGVSEPDPRLPTRLLKTDHYPNPRLNIYSRPETIAFVKHTLRNNPEAFARIRNSRFGKLWDFPAVRCPVSCKLIHALVSRQVLSKKHYEMWTVFGGQPLRISLSEFASVTGLHCGEYPEGYDPDWHPPPSKTPDKWWSQTHRPTPKYVSMLADVDEFLNFPWGRESFIKTISTMCPLRSQAVKDEDPVHTLVKNLGQQSFRLLGFPLALQLLAFQAILVLLEYLPRSSDDDILLNLPDEHFPPNPSLSHEDVLNAELHPNVRQNYPLVYAKYYFAIVDSSNETYNPFFQLCVNPLIPIDAPPGFIGWGEFAEQEVQDRKVAYLEELIANNHRFSKAEWPGGATDYKEVVHCYKPPRVVHEKHIRNRKKEKRPLGVRRSPPTTRRSGRGKERVEETINSAAPEDLAERNKWLIAQVKILTEKHSKLADRTRRLERKWQLQASRSLRMPSTQRRVPRTKQNNSKSKGKEVSGSEDGADDSIISLKEGEEMPDDWMDRNVNYEAFMKSPSSGNIQFAGSQELMELSDFSPSLNQAAASRARPSKGGVVLDFEEVVPGAVTGGQSNAGEERGGVEVERSVDEGIIDGEEGIIGHGPEPRDSRTVDGTSRDEDMVGEKANDTDEKMCTADVQDGVDDESMDTVPSTKDDVAGLRVCTGLSVLVDGGVAKVVAGEFVQSEGETVDVN